MFGKKKNEKKLQDDVLNLDDIVEDAHEDLEEEIDTKDEVDSNGEEATELEENIDSERSREEEDLEEEEDFEEEDFDDEDFDEEFDDIEDEENTQIKEEKRAKRKKIALKILLGFFITIVVLYLAISAFFWKCFYYGTTINGTNFEFRSVAYVEKYMEKEVQGYELSLKENTGNTESINGANINLEYKKTDELKKLLNSQNPFLWPKAFFDKYDYKADVSVTYDEQKLSEQIQNLNCMKQDAWTKSVNAYPAYSNGTYTVTPEVFGTTINMDVFNQKVAEYISGFKPELVLEDEGCYADPTYVAESKEVTDAMNTMNTYIKGTVTYDTGDVVNADLIASWLSVDGKMKVKFDKAAIKKYLNEMGKKYDTVGKKKSITTPKGDTVSVSGGSYGWTVDEAGEYKKLLKNIKAGKPVTRELKYKTKAVSRTEPEWGTTYLEVDISSQHMWYIKDGKIKLETGVVTGRPTADRETHKGVYYVYFMQRNRVLRGTKLPDGTWPYETPVSYWMAFNAGQGFHDANWQSSFGGSRYLSHGSHGCVNMPPSKAGELYGMIKEGIPVIVHK